MAKYARNRCRSLILGGAQPFATGEPLEELGEVLGQGMEAFIQYSEKHFGPVPELRRKILLCTDPEPIRIATLKPREDISASLSNITAPCLVYCGDGDPLYSEVKKAAALIPKCEFLTLANMNHMQAMDDGKEITPHFLTFLNKHTK